MAPVDSPAHGIPPDDELDAILNGTLDGQDIFDTSNIQVQVQAPKSQKPADDAGLGIDEEITVVKKRQPIPKLDESRLLSDPGIPKLRKITKERLKFKGKGHEYSDIARMLNMYQLWLDDLYPRAKFADGLTIIEKLGHTKRIQLMRKQWIDEGKPKHAAEQSENDVEPIALDQTPQADVEQMEGVKMDNIPHGQEGSESQDEHPDKIGDTASAPMDDGPDEDELDALLAESEAPTNVPHKTAAAEVEDPFAAEMEAMAGMEDMW